MTINLEWYRYAMAGMRSMKHQLTGPRQQQARYLAGLEIRTDTSQQSLLVMVVRCSRIYRQGSQNVIHFNLCDRLESVRGVMNENGQLISLENWYPFGGTASWLTGAQAGATLKFQRYAGKERDISGLIFYGWRYYVPWLLRWLNSDPAGTVDGLNLFRMVGNNPATLRDPDGRMVDGDEHPEQREQGMLLITDNQVVQRVPVITFGTTTAERIVEPEAGTSTGIMAGTSRSFAQHHQEKVNVGPQAEVPGNRDQPVAFESDTPGGASEMTPASSQQKPGKRKRFICQFPGCTKSYANNSSLSRHRPSHWPQKDWKCDLCDSTHRSRDGLYQHTKSYHKKDSPIFECGVCKKPFTVQLHMWRHFDKKHAPQPTPTPASKPINKR